MLTVTQALVISQLGYHNALHVGVPSKTIEKLVTHSFGYPMFHPYYSTAEYIVRVPSFFPGVIEGVGY